MAIDACPNTSLTTLGCTVLQNLPKCGQVTSGVWFLLHHRQLHAEVTAPRQSWRLAPSVYTVRRTVGQFS